METANLTHLGYDSKHMHKRYWYSEEYRWRHYEDVLVGDKIGIINAPDLVIKRVIPPLGIGKSGFPATANSYALVYGDELTKDYLLGLPHDLVLVMRRPDETFRKPTPEDYE